MPSPKVRDFALTTAGALRLYDTEELMKLPPPHWMVDDLLTENSFAVLYGPSGWGKSFITMDIALSVATGLRWTNQRRTEPGFVLYVSAEGRAGLGQRVTAWMRDKQLDPPDADIVWLPEAVSISSESEHIDILFQRFEELERQPDLVIIDTLARCFEGDENKTEDMSRFVRGCDKIRHEYGCSVLAVHHTNIQEGRERGNGALRAAADAMVRVIPGRLGEKAPGGFQTLQGVGCTLVVDKQKDAPSGPVGLGTLRPVFGTSSAIVDIRWVNVSED